MSATVITVDGPSGCGKGTMSQRLARHFDFYLLDSGALYRWIGWRVHGAGVDPSDVAAVLALADEEMAIDFKMAGEDEPAAVWVNGVDQTESIRSDSCAQMASKISQIQEVRSALLGIQRAFVQAPGLVADGRDMGTVVFPDAAYKLYLDARPEVRAQRRYKQLSGKGFCVSLPQIMGRLVARDQRDRNREHSPLRPAEGAMVVDTSDDTADQVFAKILRLLQERGLGA